MSSSSSSIASLLNDFLTLEQKFTVREIAVLVYMLSCDVSQARPGRWGIKKQDLGLQRDFGGRGYSLHSFDNFVDRPPISIQHVSAVFSVELSA